MKSLPKGWHELTIKTYINYIAATQSRIKGDAVDHAINVIAALRETTAANILSGYSARQLKEQARLLRWLAAPPKETTPAVFFKINGKKYKAFIFTEQQSAGQFIDFNAICRKTNSTNYIENIHELLGCLCVPVKRGVFFRKGMLSFARYEYEGYHETAKEFYENMTMDVAYPFFVFFCKVINQLSQVLRGSLASMILGEIRKMPNQKEAWKKVSRIIGGGM